MPETALPSQVVGQCHLLLLLLLGSLALHLGDLATLALAAGLFRLGLVAVFLLLFLLALEPVLKVFELVFALVEVGDVFNGGLGVLIFASSLSIKFLLIIRLDTLVHILVSFTLATLLHGIQNLLPDVLADVEGLVAVSALPQTLKKLSLDGPLQLGGCLSLALSRGLAVSDFGGQLGNQLLAQTFVLGGNPTHANLHLRQAGESLLALVDQELGPVDESLVDLLQGLGVVIRQLDALPHLGRQMRSLDSLHVEV